MSTNNHQELPVIQPSGGCCGGSTRTPAKTETQSCCSTESAPEPAPTSESAPTPESAPSEASCGCDHGEDEAGPSDSCHAPNATHGYHGDKDAYLKRLRRIEGQVRGIQRMVNEDKYCIDILTQISAINKALHAVSIGLLEEHINHCVVNAAHVSHETGDDSIVQEKVAEATAAISRLMRS